jgi:NAD(P)-dependent dehydrogenase (short-subunit alcohol dehydrogenase family)
VDAKFFSADVSKEAEVEQLINSTVAAYGRLDVVVNCAGITASGRVEQFPVRRWRQVFEANVVGTFLVCKHAIPHLRASGHGSIVNLGSTYGFVGAAGSSAYAATKSAVISLTKTLALELASDGVRVNALCPGSTDTAMTDAWKQVQADPKEAMDSLFLLHPLGRISSPEEQAYAALFLASDEASFVTGHSLLVDGGYTAR